MSPLIRATLCSFLRQSIQHVLHIIKSCLLIGSIGDPVHNSSSLLQWDWILQYLPVSEECPDVHFLQGFHTLFLNSYSQQQVKPFPPGIWFLINLYVMYMYIYVRFWCSNKIVYVSSLQFTAEEDRRLLVKTVWCSFIPIISINTRSLITDLMKQTEWWLLGSIMSRYLIVDW